MIAAVSAVQAVTVAIAATVAIAGAIGVVALRNPVHNALSLVATLFGVAVLYVAQGAYFLAAVQVIVYAGAIVVLILFVMMLLGVDRFERLVKERRPSNLALAGGLAGGFAVLTLVAVLAGTANVTGQRAVTGALDADNDLEVIGEALFTKYVFAFEITSLLLMVAIVGAVVLSRRASGDPIDLDEFPPPASDDPDEAELEGADEAEGVES